MCIRIMDNAVNFEHYKYQVNNTNKCRYTSYNNYFISICLNIAGMHFLASLTSTDTLITTELYILFKTITGTLGLHWMKEYSHMGLHWMKVMKEYSHRPLAQTFVPGPTSIMVTGCGLPSLAGRRSKVSCSFSWGRMDLEQPKRGSAEYLCCASYFNFYSISTHFLVFISRFEFTFIVLFYLSIIVLLTVYTIQFILYSSTHFRTIETWRRLLLHLGTTLSNYIPYSKHQPSPITKANLPVSQEDCSGNTADWSVFGQILLRGWRNTHDQVAVGKPLAFRQEASAGVGWSMNN